MSKIKYLVYTGHYPVQPYNVDINDLIKKGMVSHYEEGALIIIAAKGVNKTALRKLLRKESK